jgi:hypothetical protein
VIASPDFRIWTQTGRRCIARPALRRDVLLPKVRDIKSQGLSYVIRGCRAVFSCAIIPSSRDMFSSKRWLVSTRQ